jgi:DNA polymerase III delta subunit
MLYVILGESRKGREKLKELLSVLKKKQPDAEEIRLEPDTFSAAALDELIASQGLFSAKYIVVLDSLFTDKEHKESLLERLKDIAEAEHAFLIIEEKVDAATKKKLTSIAQKIIEVEEKVAAKPFDNSFALAEALGNRDKEALWKLYAERIARGDKVEEIHGQLVWQAKSMLLASKTKTAEEADMKEYPYKKAKAFLANYTEPELETLLFNLVCIYHEAHRGGVELEVALEKLILEL